MKKILLVSCLCALFLIIPFNCNAQYDRNTADKLEQMLITALQKMYFEEPTYNGEYEAFTFGNITDVMLINVDGDPAMELLVMCRGKKYVIGKHPSYVFEMEFKENEIVLHLDKRIILENTNRGIMGEYLAVKNGVCYLVCRGTGSWGLSYHYESFEIKDYKTGDIIETVNFAAEFGHANYEYYKVNEILVTKQKYIAMIEEIEKKYVLISSAEKTSDVYLNMKLNTLFNPSQKVMINTVTGAPCVIDTAVDSHSESEYALPYERVNVYDSSYGYSMEIQAKNIENYLYEKEYSHFVPAEMQINMYSRTDGHHIKVYGKDIAAFSKEYFSEYENITVYRPVNTLWSATYETAKCEAYELADYIKWGWYTYAVNRLYSADGREIIIPIVEKELCKSQGWYEYPVTTLYGKNGDVMVVNNADAYLYVGSYPREWWYEPQN